MPLPFAAIASAASSIGSGIMGLIGQNKAARSQIKSVRMQNAAQAQLQEKEFIQNQRMWELNNQYNTPEMQMARLKEAGLNPNLVYGSGSVTGNTSTQIPRYQAPQLQREPLEAVNPLSMLSAFFDLKTKSAQADLVEENKNAQKIQNKYLDMKLLQEQGLRFIQGQKGYGEIGKGDRQTMNSPYMQKFQAEVRTRQQQNALNDVQLQFYKNMPKEVQWLAPLLLKLIK